MNDYATILLTHIEKHSRMGNGGALQPSTCAIWMIVHTF